MNSPLLGVITTFPGLNNTKRLDDSNEVTRRIDEEPIRRIRAWDPTFWSAASICWIRWWHFMDLTPQGSGCWYASLSYGTKVGAASAAGRIQA